MHSAIEQALIRFETVCENWSHAPGRMEKVSAAAFIWHPSKLSPSLTRPIGISLQAITHGDETGGIDVLIECIRLIKGRLIQPEFPVAFVLGNPEAAMLEKRFAERDLNRSFGRAQDSSLEDRRARILEGILSQSSFFLDFHQTIEPTLQPFFIFPFTHHCLAFASGLHEKIPIITHWGMPFSKDGMCTDEYVNHQGGVGITLELGQKGFDVYHSAIGLQVALAALHYVASEISGEHLHKPARLAADLYTWKAIVPYEKGARLNEGLFNFQVIRKGDVIGHHDHARLHAPHDGWLLFPKYQRDPTAPVPKELYRILKKIAPDELGQIGVVGV